MSAIEIRDLTFSYEKLPDTTILDIPQFLVEKNEKVFLHGPSGCGKSTLLNILSGVLKPKRGTDNLLGEDIFQLKSNRRDSFRGEHLGIIFQNFNLIPYLSVAENIALPCQVNRHRREKLTTELNSEIERLAGHLGITPLLQKKSTKLSIGQQQRVAVARALIGRPEIVVADEPTSSLDDGITDEFINLLLQEHKNDPFTLVFVSHDQRLSSHFDRKLSFASLNKIGGEQ